MQRMRWRMGLAALVGGLVLGCEHEAGTRYPPGPLLVSKKPVEGKVESAAPVLLARSEPTTPSLPPLALAKSDTRVLETPLSFPSPPQRLVQPPTKPAVRSRQAPLIVATPAVRRRVPGD